ncbi:MAG TPA: Gmad2 immunoglobulin-like domain-containing protein [Nocardioides sp.]|nr:Gmad2 immunoglobulin-like domain-containing protein [Nocardioides sp.]
MNDTHDARDPRLSHLLSDAVSDVEPQDALSEIRNRTKVTAMSARRPWLYAVGGAVVATAATVAVVAAVANSPQNTADPGPTTSQSPSDDVSPTEEPSPTEGDETTEPSASPSESTSSAGPFTLASYFVRDTPQGLRLAREFSSVAGDVDPHRDAVRIAVLGRSHDPDYRSLWPEGSDVGPVTASEGSITVELLGDVRDRPAGMSQEEAELALQQVVYSAQAAVGQGRLPVQLTLDGTATDQVLGVPTSEPLTNAPENETLALVSISSLSEDETVRDRFVVSGIANSFEATVPWEVRQGDRVVARGFATAEGWMDKLYPWTTQVDVSRLAPGTYTFAAMTDDPSGGAEGAGPTEDTKTIVVE